MTRSALAALAFLFLARLAVADGVPGDPLPADGRPHAFDTKHVALEFSIDLAKQRIEARATISLVAAAEAPLSEVALDAWDFAVRKVEVDGQPAGFRHDGRVLTIPIPTLAKGTAATLAIDYVLDQPKKGFYFVLPNADEPTLPRQVYTQSEPDETRYWIPCFDQPDDKVTSEVRVTLPKGLTAISNGGLVSKSDDDAKGTSTFHWRQAIAHSVYLIVVTAGDYVKIEDRWRDVPVEYYVSPDEAEHARRSFGKTPEMLEFFSTILGYPYPYEKYAQVTVRNYMWGGMEHTTATTQNAGTIHDERSELDWTSEGLVSHELAHQWFGDLVTCKTWAHLWLNESFATHLALLWTEHAEGLDEYRMGNYHTRNGYFGQVNGGGMHPLVHAGYGNCYDMFDGHSYNKGSQVLHMLRWMLGDEVFFRALFDYLVDNKERSVTTARLQASLEEAESGEAKGQLQWFFDEWAYKPGHPKFAVSWQWVADKKVVHLVVDQNQSTEAGIAIFRMPVDVRIDAGGESKVHRIEVSKRRDEFDLPAAEAPRGVFFDHGHQILAEIDQKRSLAELLYQAATDDDVVGRYLAVGSLQEHVANFDVVTALAGILKKDGSAQVRGRAVEVLAERKDELALYHLLAALGDASSSVRERVASRLDWFDRGKTVPTMRHLAAQDPSYSVSASAAYSLAEAKAEGAWESLAELSKVDTFRDNVREGALKAMVVLGDLRAIDRALELGRPGNPGGVRGAAFELLGKMAKDREDAVDFLIAQLGDASQSLRGAAAEALAEMGSTRALAAVKARRDAEPIERAKKRMNGAIEKIEKAVAATSAEAVKLREQQIQVAEERAKVRDERLGLREKMIELREKELELEKKELGLRAKELELREKAAKAK